jgi:chromosome segregation ATPase
LQALKGWLSERPLKPNQQDATFLRLSIKKYVDALNIAIQNDSQVTDTPVKKLSRVKTEWASSDTNSVGSNHSGPSSSKRRETLLFECITKQDAILGAVTKQTQQQTILNKITVLTQAISGYQQEISSLRSTLNDTDNRILKVEMRIAEMPESEERLSLIVAKQQEAKNQTEVKLKEFQQLILESRSKIESNSKELDELEVAIPPDGSPSTSRKRKFGEDTEEDGSDHQAEAEAAGQREL